MITVNNVGQITGDTGIAWCKDVNGFYSFDPRGYFIERLDGNQIWTLFRKTASAIPREIPYVRQILIKGSIQHCMLVADIYEIRRIF